MSHDIDGTKISMGVWKALRVDMGPKEGELVGFEFFGADHELQGSCFLTKEEALELRDYINKHLEES